MADLLSNIVQALRNAGGTSSSGSQGAAGSTGIPASLAGPEVSGQRLLSTPQMLQVMAVARDQVLMGIGRQQLTLTPQQLPSASSIAGQAAGLQIGQQVLMQLLNAAGGSSEATANARPQLQSVLWQQVITQLTQRGLISTSASALQPKPANLQLPVQLAPTAGNSQLIMRPSGLNSGLNSGSATQWQLPTTQLGSQVNAQIAAAVAKAGGASGQVQPAQLQLSITPASAQHPQGPRVNLQVNIGGTPTTTQIPLQQLPPALLGQLLGVPVKNATVSQPLSFAPARTAAPTPVTNPAVAPSDRMQASVAQLLPLERPSQALAPLQGRAQSPAQVQAFLQSLTSSAPNQPSQPGPPAASQAIQQVAQSILGQLPQGQDFARSEQLQQWVSQWFAAKPVSLQPQQSLAGIGQLLLLALGAKLSQNTGGGATTTTPSNQFTQNLNQWLQGTAAASPAAAQAAAPNPGPAAAQSPNFAGLSPVLLQQLLQNLGGGMNSARMSQANLVETNRAGAPDYHILLPMGSSGQPKDAELLIQRRREKKKKYEQAAEDQWLFKLRMDLQQYGPVLVKGKYQASGTKIQFITENIGARVHIQHNLKLLEARLVQLKVTDVELTAIRGKVPETLREQGENMIHIQV